MMDENRLPARRFAKGDVVHRSSEATLSGGRLSPPEAGLFGALGVVAPGLWTRTTAPDAPRQTPKQCRSYGPILTPEALANFAANIVHGGQ